MLHANHFGFNPAEGYRVVLASASPRRKELLESFIPDFTVRVLPDIHEDYPKQLPTADVPEFLARQKAEAYRPTLAANELLLTADTIVSCSDRVLGKPVSRDHAIEMLLDLSGHVHLVRTGVCLTSCTHQRAFSDSTSVSFAPLTRDEITFYVDTYCPFDKAGAYGIQDWIGIIGVESLSGSYYNVMGLPTHLLYREMMALPPPSI
jgi:septum formation protein